jgi:hypothetical protein
MFGRNLLGELGVEAGGYGREGSTNGHCGLPRCCYTEQAVNVSIVVTKARSVQVLCDCKAQKMGYPAGTENPMAETGVPLRYCG